MKHKQQLCYAEKGSFFLITSNLHETILHASTLPTLVTWKYTLKISPQLRYFTCRVSVCHAAQVAQTNAPSTSPLSKTGRGTLLKECTYSWSCSLSHARGSSTSTQCFETVFSKVFSFSFNYFSFCPPARPLMTSSEHAIQISCSTSPPSSLHLSTRLCPTLPKLLPTWADIRDFSPLCCQYIKMTFFCTRNVELLDSPRNTLDI